MVYRGEEIDIEAIKCLPRSSVGMNEFHIYGYGLLAPDFFCDILKRSSVSKSSLAQQTPAYKNIRFRGSG